MKSKRLKSQAAAVSIAMLGACAAMPQAHARSLDQIDHIVVIYMENHSFDNLLALFPKGDTLVNAKSWPQQVDKTGKSYDILPAAMDTSAKPPQPDVRFPKNLPNAPWQIDQFVPPTAKVPDLVHRFYQNQEQIDGGRNDKFAALSDAGGLSMGWHDTRGSVLWRLASEFTLADNFFQAAFGGSFLNHFWLVCACTPTYGKAPDSLRAVVDGNGTLVKDGAVTPDGFAVNTLQSTYQPHAASITDQTKLLPPQTLPTIGDRLSDKGVTWAWYSGGYDDALAGKPAPSFQFRHQPFIYFQQFADGTEAKKTHLKDETDLLADIEKGTLPAVTFYKPLGLDNEHPGYADLAAGDKKLGEIVGKIQNSPLWAKTAIIVTYDENGGYWDHVAPPKGDRWGPGTRIPTVIVSPFTRKGYVDHTAYDTTSILKLIEERFALAPLGERDAKTNSLSRAFAFGNR